MTLFFFKVTVLISEWRIWNVFEAELKQMLLRRIKVVQQLHMQCKPAGARVREAGGQHDTRTRSDTA